MGSSEVVSNAVVAYTGDESRQIRQRFVSTSDTIPGHQVLRAFGVARGHAARSCQDVDARNVRLWAALHEEANDDAVRRMTDDAEKRGANGIVGVHLDTSTVHGSIIQTVAYGTAVYVEPSPS